MDEEAYLCGHIAMAARQLGFKIAEVFDGGTISYAWIDLMNHRSAWLCEGADTKHKAFVNACRQMQEYLTIPTQ